MAFLPAWFPHPFQKRDGALETKADPTYGVVQQFFTPGQPIFSDRNYRTFVSEGYKRCGTAYACINKIAGGAAGIKWKLYTDRTMTREIPEHPLLDLWRKPNPRNGTGSFVEQSFGYWHLSGNMYTWANRPNPNEPPVELWQLRPDLVKIVAGESDVAGYVYGYNTPKARVFDTAEIMHMRFHSYDDEFYGLSPLQVAMWLIDQSNEGNAWNTALMQNAGKPASVFTSKGYLTVEQRNQVRQEILRRYSGKRNAGFPLILEADMTWQQMSMSPYELDWLASRELNTREIASILDIAPELVGDSAGKTFANQHEARQALYTENILPKMDRYVDETNGWLIPMYADLAAMGAYFTYDKKDIETLAQLYADQEQASSTKATGLWQTGQCDLYTAQGLQGIDQDKNGKGIYFIGGILLRSQDLQAYAQQAMQKPAAPPSVVPENLLDNPPPTSGLPAPTKPLALPAPQGGTNADNTSNHTGNPGAADAGTGKQPATAGTDSGASSTGKSADLRAYRHRLSGKALDLTTTEQKAAYLATIEASRKTWEEKAVKRLASYFNVEQKAVVSAVKHDHAGDADIAIQEALVSQSGKLQSLIVSLYQDVGTDIGGQVATALDTAKTRPSGYARKSSVDVYNAATIQYLLSLAGTKITQISATTLLYLRQILADGVANGESYAQLAADIEDAYSGYIIPERAATIAQTEVAAASNWASMQAAGSSGLTLNKVWLASMDGHTRPAHAEADGQEVPMDEPFEVGGEQLDYPGDPGGSAANVCNCRCTTYYKRVTSDITGDSSDDASSDDSSKVRTFVSVRDFYRIVEAGV
jgi:HK97 family phage portal protein